MFNLGNAEKNTLGTKNIDNNYDFDMNTYVYDENIKSDSHISVVKRIKEKSIVLDVGCSSGLIGYLLSKYKKCTIDGIEYNKEAYKSAKSKCIYRDVLNFSITDSSDSEYKKFFKKNRKYDYIIFADVLEHLVEPWKVLVDFSTLLNKNGKIIISLPNIAHIDIIKGLINQEFNYSRWGILDKTHLIFFTPSSFKDMIYNIADEYKVYFNVDKVEDIIVKPDYFEKYSQYELFNDKNLEEYSALQNIYVLTKASSKKQMRTNIGDIDEDKFDKILNELNDLCIQNKQIKEKNQGLESDLNKIVNSKRWKIINKLLKLIGK